MRVDNDEREHSMNVVVPMNFQRNILVARKTVLNVLVFPYPLGRPIISLNRRQA